MGTKTPFSLFLFILLSWKSIQVSQANETNKASFGEVCGDGIRCNSRHYLTCSDGVCKCLQDDKMVFSEKQEKCVVLSGERCYLTPWDVTPQETETNLFREKLTCVENADCGSDGFCKCLSNYFENGNGTCTPRFLYGNNCTGDDQCREDLFLGCYEGTCSCKKTEAGYLASEGKCAGLVGQTCEFAEAGFSPSRYTSYRLSGKFKNCIANAECRYRNTDRYSSYEAQDPYNYYNQNQHQFCLCKSGTVSSQDGFCRGDISQTCDENNPCIDSLACFGGRCRCPDQYREEYYSIHTLKGCRCRSHYIRAENGSCHVKYLARCEDDTPCYAGLHCIRGQCICPFPHLQYYDEARKECIGHPESPCTFEYSGGSHSYNCTENAECLAIGIGESSFKECKCKEGFIESGNRKCQITNGFPCDSTRGGCDAVAGLVCMNKTCSCPYHQEYDKLREQCRGLVGASCESSVSDQQKFCTDGAFCKKFRELPPGRTTASNAKAMEGEVKEAAGKPAGGTCRCRESFMTTSDRKCVPKVSVSDNSQIDTKSITESIEEEQKPMEDILPKPFGVA